ncbi:MAG: hypothetical protein DMG71_03685 [Acidobacteria bacterium]|nr:MAG: hypothetical protein DMG71_03685 [Acidobacteriota bacterium]
MAECVATLYTIGHSTRSIDEFLSALRAHSIGALVDIRSFPVSRRLPHFNRESLEQTLSASGIQYDSPNVALRNASFRNYADYMLTAEFEHGISELLSLAQRSPTAYMCAERVYFRCHRMLVSDWLVAHGHAVLHIDAEGPPRTHKLMSEARVVDGQVIYRGDRLL